MHLTTSSSQTPYGRLELITFSELLRICYRYLNVTMFLNRQPSLMVRSTIAWPQRSMSYSAAAQVERDGSEHQRPRTGRPGGHEDGMLR